MCCDSASFRHTSLKLMFVIVVGVGLAISTLSLRYSTYGSDSVTFTGGDQLLIPTSTYFNQQIQFTRKESKLTDQVDTVLLYILPHVPAIARDRLVYTDGVKFHMPSWSYQYWGLHLLAGTELNISICADLHLQFYIIKGKRKLQNWKETTLFYKYDFQARIHPKKSCTEKKSFKHHQLKVTDSDVYYLMFSSSVGWRFFTEVTVMFKFNRTYYDLSNYQSKCVFSSPATMSKTKACTGDLRYGSTDIALLQAASSLSNPSRTFYNFEFYFLPLPRWSFYGNLFGYIYLTVISGTLLYSLWRFCVRLLIGNKSDDPEKEREPLLHERRSYSYSLHSTAGKEPWHMISPEDIPRTPISTVGVPEDYSDGSISENDWSGDDEVGPLRPRRHPRLSSFASNESAESHFKITRQQSMRNDRMRRENQYMNDQQLLDSVMTSAGISAI